MKRILIDCDTGIDDAGALLYALFSPAFHIEGITTLFGNSDADQSARSCLGILRLADPGYEIPVAVGAKGPLNGETPTPCIAVHGEDGVGGAALPAADQQPVEVPGPEFIVEKARELEGELEIVALGPLTNLALALRLEPRLPRLVKRLTVMGGNLDVPGNCTPYAEANFYADPQAADEVLGAGFNMILVGLDVTRPTVLTLGALEHAMTAAAGKKHRALCFLKEALAQYFRFYLAKEGMHDACSFHDPLAVLAAEDPSLCRYKMVRARVESDAPRFRGMVTQDQSFIPAMPGRPEICAAVEVDADLALRRFFSAFI